MGEILLSSASIRLPTNRGGPSVHLQEKRPSWVLLDFLAFVLDQRNSTTATCKFMDDKELQVTFVLSQPPNVSYLCVYCRNMKLSAYAMEPQIVATDDDLVLIRIVLGGASGLQSESSAEYFIYKAGEGEMPSLEHLPRPRPNLLRGNPLGLLKYDTGYIIVSLGKNTSARYWGASRDQFEVCLFDSKDKVWTTEPVVRPRIDHFLHDTSKVITIGGERGTVAFVDLWRGILLYDVLAKDPMLRYIRLPKAICGKEEYDIDPLLLRDIAVIKGSIKYLEMGIKIRTGKGLKGPKVATYSMPVTCRPEDTWHRDCMIDVTKIRDDENIFSPEILQMLADEKSLTDEESMKLVPTMEGLRTCHPALCLHDEDTVYFLTKIQPRSKKACVIAVSMTEGSVKAVARFGAERIYGVNFTFIKSRVSSYLNMAPGTEGAVLEKKGKKKRGGFKVA